MTATLTATAAAPTAAPPPRRRRTLLLVGLLLVALVGGGGAAAVLLLGGEAEAEEAPVAEGAVVPVAELTANLAGERIAFAKVAFSAVLAEGTDAAAVSDRFALVKDAAITELSTFAPDHLRTTAGMDELRARLTERAAALYPDGEVLRIVLTELVVQ
jgi:flagellar protein FliL